MDSDLEHIQLPALVGMDMTKMSIQVVRSLTKGDITGIEHSRELTARVQPIMNMCGILYINHAELLVFLNSLRKREPHEYDKLVNASRYIFNYVASADSLLGHFTRKHKRICRANGRDDGTFEALLKELRAKDDDFEFFEIYRDHIVHMGVPVGTFIQSRNIAEEDSWQILFNSADLTVDRYGKRASCRLIKSREQIDLISHLLRLHKVIDDRIFNFITSFFWDDLVKAQVFHAEVTEKVQEYGDNYAPFLVVDRKIKGKEFKYEFQQLPADFFTHMKIDVRLKKKE